MVEMDCTIEGVSMKMGVRISIEIDQFQKMIDALVVQKVLCDPCCSMKKEKQNELQHKIDRVTEDAMKILYRTRKMVENANT
jgi:hypothetical protein